VLSPPSILRVQHSNADSLAFTPAGTQLQEGKGIEALDEVTEYCPFHCTGQYDQQGVRAWPYGPTYAQ
jgi:hypothetical protein